MRVASLDFASNLPPAVLVSESVPILVFAPVCINSTPCASVMFNTHGIPYTRVCGKVLAYRFGTTDAFGIYGLMQNQTNSASTWMESV